MSAPSLLLDAPACCDDEAWEPVPDWPHEASTCGRIRSIDRLDASGCLRLGGELALCPDRRKGKGYLYATLRDGERRRKAAVAVLVLEAHRGLRPGPGWEACHNYGIRTDNHLARLRWDTREANIADMARHRLERACDEDAPGGPRDVTGSPFPQDVACRLPSRHGVTGDGPHGTGSFPFPFIFSSVLTSLNPVPGPVSVFRSLRNRLAA